MDNQLFRQKSIDRISSPEQLHDYMRVTSPRLWMILSVIIALMIGLIVFSFTVTMESSIAVTVKVERYDLEDNGETKQFMNVSVEIPADQTDVLAVGQEVRFANRKGRIEYLFQDQSVISAMIAMENENQLLPEGSYEGEVIIERRSAVDYLLN